MAQLHFYVPEDVAQAIQKRAQQARLPVSRFLAELVKREVKNAWPEHYFEAVAGQWQDKPLQREPEGDFESRPEF